MSYPTQWTPGVKSAFLTALAETGEVFAACECVNLSPQGAYRHRALDPDFARAWDVARHQSREVVFDRLTSRALDGWQEDVYYKGQLIGTKQRHDNRLILALIARLDKLVDGKAEARQAARGAPHFAAMLDDIAAGQPIDRHFIASREDRQAIMIDRARRRSDYAFYERDLTADERDWVDGIEWIDDDEDEVGEEVATQDEATATPTVAPAKPAPAKAGEPGPLSPKSNAATERHNETGPGSGPGRREDGNVTPPTPASDHPRVHHSSSLLSDEDALKAIAAADAEMENDPEWQAELAKWAMIEKAMHGERSVWKQERGGPMVRML